MFIRLHKYLPAMLLLMVITPVAGAELSASVSYTSDYTVLGISRSQGEAALQGGINLETRNGFYASLWASQVEYAITAGNLYPSAGYRDERDLELDIYIGYLHELTPDWRGEIQLARYTYPGANTTRDWAYTEVLLALHYRDRFSLALGTSQNLFAQDKLTHSVAANTRLFGWHGWVSSAGLGYVDAAALPEGYWYWQLGLTRQFGALRIGLLWHDTDNTARRLFGDQRAGERLELRLDVSF